MRLSTDTLIIVANPFAAPLAPDGRATALCPCDPAEPTASGYVGARTIAASKKQAPALRSALGMPRDKVSVMYRLDPVSVPDTSHYRAKLRSGEVFAADGALIKLRGAALAALSEHGGDRSTVLAAWREQGLGSVVDAVIAWGVKGSPPASNEARVAGPTPSIPVLVPGDTLTEGAVS